MKNQEKGVQAQVVHKGVPRYLVVTVGVGLVLTSCLHMVAVMGMTFTTEATLRDLFLIWSGMLILSTYLLATTKKE